MNAALELRGVRKRYGKRTALDGLDLQVPRGCVLGLIGPNGAGKTTAFGIVGGTVRADEGHIDVLGQGPFDARKHRGQVGILPQDSELHPNVPIGELLRFFARLQGMRDAAARREVDRLLETLKLRDRADARVGELSHGMRRRVAVLQALLGSPALVLLDEPTSGLDPRLVVEMRELILAERGARTVVVSSHVLSDLEAVCDELRFMEHGRCVRSGATHQVLRRDRLIRVRVARAAVDSDVVTRLAERTSLRIVARGSLLEVEALTEGETPVEMNGRLLPALLSEGLGIIDVRVGESLEDAYAQKE